MSNYIANPRGEELQLLKQLRRSHVITTHRATYDIAKRLEANNEAIGWWNADATYEIEITSKGMKVLTDEARS